jgi:hypothetical protein
VDAGRSEDRPSRRPRPANWLEGIAALGGAERMAAMGAVVCAAATALPWYKAPVGGLVKTGLGSFGFAMAAQLITAVAALVLLAEFGRGRRPPTPLHKGTLLAAAGIWAGAIVVFLMFDRPQFPLAGFDQDYSLAYGIFVSLAGAGLLAASGLRIRQTEIAAERRP